MTVDVRGEQLSQALAGPYHQFIVGVIAFSLAHDRVTGVTDTINLYRCHAPTAQVRLNFTKCINLNGREFEQVAG